MDGDAVVIGSGAGGATVAWDLAKRGLQVTLLEEGVEPTAFKPSAYSAIQNLFRDFGTQAAHTKDSLFPILQGCSLGGTTVINGAIVQPLPKEVYQEWCEAMPALRTAVPFTELEKLSDELAPLLQVRRNLSDLKNSFPAPRTLSQFTQSVEAMPRTAPDCIGSGRCLQGCPSGAKLSLNKTLIEIFKQSGGKVRTAIRVERLIVKNNRVHELEVRDRQTGKISRLKAPRHVVIAGGAVQTPLLLLRSGLQNYRPGIGQGFQCHLSTSVVGILPGKAFDHDGPPQGWQASTENPRLKVASQLVPPELIFARLPVFGEELHSLLRIADQASCWTTSVRARAHGTIRLARLSRGRAARIDFSPTPTDLADLKQGVVTLSRFLFASGAEKVFHGVAGLPRFFQTAQEIEALHDLRLSAQNFTLGAGHLFGGACMGEGETSVVDFDCRFQGLKGLFIADASVFPSNTGGNPQWAIMTMARWAAKKIAEDSL